MKTVKISAISFSVVLAAAAVGACSTPPQQSGVSQPTPKVVSNVHPYTAGQGTVQYVDAGSSPRAHGSS